MNWYKFLIFHCNSFMSPPPNFYGGYGYGGYVSERFYFREFLFEFFCGLLKPFNLFSRVCKAWVFHHLHLSLLPFLKCSRIKKHKTPLMLVCPQDLIPHSFVKFLLPISTKELVVTVLPIQTLIFLIFPITAVSHNLISPGAQISYWVIVIHNKVKTWVAVVRSLLDSVFNQSGVGPTGLAIRTNNFG